MLVYHSKKYKGIVVRRYILSCVPSVLLLVNSLLNPVTNFAGFEKQITNRSSDFVTAGGESWHLPELQPCAAQPWDGPHHQILKTGNVSQSFQRSVPTCRLTGVSGGTGDHFHSLGVEFCQAHKKNRLH